MSANPAHIHEPNALEILIVDDDPLLCERLEALLAAHDLRALSVDSLEMAREAMRAIYFPLVILDRHLGDGDGLDLCREYRASQRGRRVCILMLSGSDGPEGATRALASGADEFLSKRTSDAHLLAHVTRLYASACGREMPVPDNDSEPARLRALTEYGILDTAPEQPYDDVVRLASLICKTPMALISLVDDRRQWFKAKTGLTAEETPREHAFCSHAIERPDEVLVVPDARRDARFADNPFVTGDPNIRFYAGAPLVDSAGHALGTVCVVDREPRSLDAEALEGLRALSRQVVLLLQERRHRKELESRVIAQQAVEVDLRRSAALFRDTFESSPLGIALISLQGQWIRVNRSLCAIVGRSREAFLQTTLHSITCAEDLDKDAAQRRDLLRGVTRGYETEKRYIHSCGHLVSVQLSVSLVRDEHENPCYFLVQVRNSGTRANEEAGLHRRLAHVG